MRPVVGVLIFGWFFLGPWCMPASADGGNVRLSAHKGGYRITVFSAPSPFRAGPVDISVLVQDSSTAQVLPIPSGQRLGITGLEEHTADARAPSRTSITHADPLITAFSRPGRQHGPRSEARPTINV